MTERVQIIGHTTGNADAFIGLSREVTVDTSKKELRVHDGLSKGGIPTARADFQNVATSTVIAKSMEQNTIAFFAQVNAPLGWVQLVDSNDRALRVVSGASGGVAGGTHPLSTPPSTAHLHTGPSHTHTGPSHQHSYSSVISHSHGASSSGIVIPYTTITGTRFSGDGGGSGATFPYTYTVKGAAHSHTITVDPTGVASALTAAAGTGNTGASGTGNTSSSSPAAFAPQYLDVIKGKKE